MHVLLHCPSILFGVCVDFVGIFQNSVGCYCILLLLIFFSFLKQLLICENAARLITVPEYT